MLSVLKIIGFVLLGILGLIAVFILILKLMVIFGDKIAIDSGRKYCEERGYTFKKVEAYPNHYGLFFVKDGMHFYASFDYVEDGVFKWKKGSPEEKVEQRLEKKKLREIQKKNS